MVANGPLTLEKIAKACSKLLFSTVFRQFGAILALANHAPSDWSTHYCPKLVCMELIHASPWFESLRSIPHHYMEIYSKV